MTGKPHTVLLTGASGVVGQAILRAAQDFPSVRIIATSRDPGLAEPAAVRVLRCDLTLPRFGLSEPEYGTLVSEVDDVIHSAGLTEWGLPAPEYEPVNVDGTRSVIEFAERAGAAVHFMSTAFVAALAPSAAYALRPANVTANYVRSKALAEELLRASGVPHTIFRPTNLIGDSATGWTSRGQIVQLMSNWICRGRAPFIPVHEGNRIDVVPQDMLAQAVLRAIELGDDHGEFWVTYGDEAMDMHAAIAVCMKHAAGQGRHFDAPRVVDPDALDTMDLGHLPPMAQSYLSILRDVSEVTRCSGGVLPTSMPLLRERYGIARVDDTLAYMRTLQYAGTHLS